MAPALDVCIRGAGIVGRTVALLLARERLRVGLVDQQPVASSGHSDVRAYALNPASRELLEMLRAWPDDAHATPVATMQVHGDDGGEVGFDAADQRVPALAWIVDVPALQDRLGEALRYQPLVERLPEPQPATLTVICEGRCSATREEFGVQFKVISYPQRAIAARLACEKPHALAARQWFADGEIVALLPMGGPLGAAQGNLVALVWSVREERADALMALDASAFALEVEKACGRELGAMTLTTERAAWPPQLAQADRWCGPGWALAGDAAHTVHPLAGQGLNLGLADAKALAEVLRQRDYWRGVDDMKLLRRYERSRKADVLAMGATTDALQQLFAQPPGFWLLLRNWGMSGFEHSGPFKHW